jgi:hypothetical protein
MGFVLWQSFSAINGIDGCFGGCIWYEQRLLRFICRRWHYTVFVNRGVTICHVYRQICSTWSRSYWHTNFRIFVRNLLYWRTRCLLCQIRLKFWQSWEEMTFWIGFIWRSVVFQLAIISNANFLLKQVKNGTVIKMSNLKDYDHFLKRCIDGKVAHFTHAVDAKKPLRIVLLGLPN